MLDLSPLERAAVSKFIECGDDRLLALRQQLEDCRVASREFTGVGFWTTLHVPESAAGSQGGTGEWKLTGVGAEIPGLQHGAGFLLYVSDGLLRELEGFSFDEPWPDVIDGFTVFCSLGGIRGLDPPSASIRKG